MAASWLRYVAGHCRKSTRFNEHGTFYNIHDQCIINFIVQEAQQMWLRFMLYKYLFLYGNNNNNNKIAVVVLVVTAATTSSTVSRFYKHMHLIGST